MKTKKKGLPIGFAAIPARALRFGGLDRRKGQSLLRSGAGFPPFEERVDGIEKWKVVGRRKGEGINRWLQAATPLDC